MAKLLSKQISNYLNFIAGFVFLFSPLNLEKSLFQVFDQDLRILPSYLYVDASTVWALCQLMPTSLAKVRRVLSLASLLEWVHADLDWNLNINYKILDWI